MNWMQHAMMRTAAKEDKKQEKNERDRLETAEACERKGSEWRRENTLNNIDRLMGDYVFVQCEH